MPNTRPITESAGMTMQNKVVVVTGGTSGIGQVAAEALARQGARIILIARDEARAAAALSKLEIYGPRAKHSIHIADLSSIKSTQRVGTEIAAAEDRIDVLINNAGAVFGRRELSPDGLEMSFAVNHMAYFTLTRALHDRLIETPGARIVNTASNAHESGNLDFDDLQSAKSYSNVRAYGTSKLCNVLFTRELARRLEGSGATANCLHPGFVATRFGSGAGGLIQIIAPVAKLFAVTPEQGADTIIYLASAPDVASQTGLYFHKRKAIPPSAAAQDDTTAARLWTVSEQILSRALER